MRRTTWLLALGVIFLLIALNQRTTAPQLARIFGVFAALFLVLRFLLDKWFAPRGR